MFALLIIAHGDMNIQGSSVNYYPNDQINEGAPTPIPSVEEPPMPVLENAWVKETLIES